MLPLTKNEIKWLEKSKKDRFYMGEILDEMNKRCRSYGMSYKISQKQVMQDFQGLFDPNEIVPNKDWSGGLEDNPFIRKEVKEKGRTE